METNPIRIEIYRDGIGVEPFTEWLEQLGDKTARLKVLTRLDRLEKGNYGDYKRFGSLGELRLDFGPGYRVYFGQQGNNLVLLLAGGDKSTQSSDFKLAQARWQDHLKRIK
jgi:putative addiction module killer protein